MHVRVSPESSVAPVITKTFGAGRVRQLDFKDLSMQEKVQVKGEDTHADLLTKILDPERHHKLIQMLPLSFPGTRARVGKLSGAGCGVFNAYGQCGSKPRDQGDGAAKELRTLVVEFMELLGMDACG